MTKPALRRVALVLPAYILAPDAALAGALRFGQRSGRYEFRDLPFVNHLHIPELLQRARPEGAIVWLATDDFQEIQPSLDEKLRIVSIGADPLAPGIAGVCTDDRRLVEQVAEHFHAEGYRQVACVGLPRSPAVRRRMELFRQRFGHRADVPVFEMEWPGDEKAARFESNPALERWLRKLTPPVGIVTWNSIYAQIVRRGCEKLGREVPGEVGILTLFDDRNCLIGTPQISSIRIDGGELGYAAMRLLESILDGQDPPDGLVQIPPQGLIVRGSTSNAAREGADHIERALAYIEEHACRGITVADVIEATQTISRRKFYDDFASRVGRSPAEHICHIKLVKAKQLLGETTLSITRIAGLCGFQDRSGFGNAFRNECGLTPRDFRKQATQDTQ